MEINYKSLKSRTQRKKNRATGEKSVTRDGLVYELKKEKKTAAREEILENGGPNKVLPKSNSFNLQIK